MGKIAETMAKKSRKPANKKARPSRPDSDVQRRPLPPETEARRSLRQLSRRRNHYSEYYDDLYDFEDDEEEEGNERRKEKKLKLVLKVPAPDSSNREKGMKTSTNDEDDVDVKDGEAVQSIACGEEKDGKSAGEREDTAVGSLPNSPISPHSMPLPDAKTLEPILDKLQKKDIYGVYAEPVDPEELPDYHEVIEHPMDFGTVRKKLASGAYSSLEQFESDVFLICTNAMQYNAPDTVYFKQARAIQELAKKRFRMLRIDGRKSVQKSKLICAADNPVKQFSPSRIQDRVGPDFSVANVATTGEIVAVSNTLHACVVEKPESLDNLAIEKSISSSENKLEKMEETPAKVFLPRLGKKSLDENRRTTYHISSHVEGKNDLVFTTFDGEAKQLTPAGIQIDHSYSRSLARFAAAMGSSAWTVASKRIKQVLPEGCKFGPGWVGEYEALPVPLSRILSQFPKQPDSRSQGCRIDSRTVGCSNKLVTTQNHDLKGVQLGDVQPMKEAVFVTTIEPSKHKNLNPETLSGLAAGATSQDLNVLKNMVPSKNDSAIMKQSTLSSTSVTSSVPAQVSSKGSEQNMEVTSSRLLELVSRNKERVVPASIISQGERSMPTYQSQTPQSGKAVLNGLSKSNGIRQGVMWESAIHGHPSMPPSFPSSASHKQELDDPVKLLKKLTGNVPSNSLHKRSMCSIISDSNAKISPSFPGTADSHAYRAAVRPWMSVGPTFGRDESRVSVNVLPPELASSPRAVNPEKWSHSNQTTVIPQPMQVDTFKFCTPAWQGRHPSAQTKASMHTLPPDLNVSFQAPGSPVRQSSSIRVDSQQPDLALQL